MTSPDFRLQGGIILFSGASSQITMTESEITGQEWKYNPSAERTLQIALPTLTLIGYSTIILPQEEQQMF